MRPNTLRDLALSILIGCGFATTLSAQGPVSGSDWWAQCLNTRAIAFSVDGAQGG